MPRIKSAIGLLCWVVATAANSGCKPQEAVYETDKPLAHGDEMLMPTDLQLLYDARLMQGRVRDPDLSHLQPPPPAPAEDNEAAIKAILPALLEQLAANQWSNLPQHFVPAQAAELDQMISVLQPLLDKLLAIQEATGGEGNRSPVFVQGLPADPQALLENAVVGLDDDTHAQLTLTLQLPMVGSSEVAIPFARIEERWLIEIPGFPAPQVMEQARAALRDQIPTALTNLDATLARLEAEEITAQQAQMETIQAVVGLQTSLMSVFSGAATPAETPAEAPPEPAAEAEADAEAPAGAPEP